jgi:hypothetical protein
MSTKDLRKTNEINAKRKIEIGDHVTAASCTADLEDNEQIGEIISFEPKELSESEIKTLDGHKNPKMSQLYRARVIFGRDLEVECEINKLKHAQKWFFEDDPTLGLEDQHLCLRMDPEMVLIHRRQASSKSFSSEFQVDTLRRAHEAGIRHHAKAQKTYVDFLCKQENPDAVKAAMRVGRAKAKYIQDATCRFSDDPANILANRGQIDEDESGWKFPLYDSFRSDNKYCSWNVPIPRLEGMTLLKFLGWTDLNLTPPTDEEAEETYIAPGMLLLLLFSLCSLLSYIHTHTHTHTHR